MQLKNGTYCPLLKKNCIGLECAWFTKVVGYDINTGKEVEDYQCATALVPMLLIENAGQQRQTGAAIESFRNEMVRANETNAKLIILASGAQTPKVIEVSHETDNNSI
jgi:hypothetical protein